MIEISWVNNLLSNSISGEKIIPYLGNHIENFDINDPEDLDYMKNIIKIIRIKLYEMGELFSNTTIKNYIL